MKRTTRVSIRFLPILVAGWLVGGCLSDSNPPAYRNITGIITTGASPRGGATSDATGGRTSTVDTGGFGGGGGAFNPCTDPGYYTQPACPEATIGLSDVVKGATCAPEDPQVCDKVCGPAHSGYKEMTCGATGVYGEGQCLFPADCWYACFQLPTADAPGCPVAPKRPRHNSPCSLAFCNLPCERSQTTPCEMCGFAAGGYEDSSGAAKNGWCVCVPAIEGGGKFACATYPQAWPCPNGAGCG
jgi:hypothetical protein